MTRNCAMSAAMFRGTLAALESQQTRTPISLLHGGPLPGEP